MFEDFVCALGYVFEEFGGVKVVANEDLFVSPEIFEDLLVGRGGNRPGGKPKSALLAWTDSIVEREGEGSVCAEMCVFVLCVVCLVEFGVDMVEDGMFGVCDVCVWGE